MSLTVGVIGLGPMGGNVANNLLNNGFEVSGFDLLDERIKALESAGLKPAPSIAALAEASDVLLASLPSLKALDAVIDELSQSPKDGQVLIECSTLTVEDKLAAHDRLKQSGRAMLDAPISATPAMLAKGMASIYASGEEAAYKKCVDVFEGFTATNFYVGEVGNGSRMKILANYLVHVHTTAAAECMALGQKAGLDPDLIHSVLKEGAGASRMFDIRGLMMAKSDYREGGGTMFDVYEKDATIITEFAAKMRSPIDLYVSARQKMNSTLALGYGHLDTSAVCIAVERAAGINRKLIDE